MDFRKICGFALGLFGAIMMWRSGMAVAEYFDENGTSDITRILFNPDYSLRMLAAMAAFLAGLAALTERRGGSWLAGLSAFLLLIQTMAILAGRGSVYFWQAEAAFMIIVTCLFLSLVAMNGGKAREEAKKEAEAAA
ncbi:MAG: hypothetical protein AAF296_04885 [Pseudomonadota bacterium]